MRVLHLIDAASPQATCATLGLAGESLGQLGQTTEHLVLLGGSDLKQAARTAGVQTATTMGVPFGQAIMGWPQLRRYTHRHGPFDLVHCWSIGALSLAALLFRSIPRILTLTVEPEKRAIGWLRTLSHEARSPTVLLPTSSTIRRALLSGGVRESVVHVLRPGINLSLVRPDDRHTLRRKWHANCDTVKVMALLSDPPHAGDLVTAGTAIILAGTSETAANMKLRLLVHPDQANRPRVQQAVDQMGFSSSIIQEPGLASPWSVLPGCDLALALGPAAGGLSLLWAMAANIPIIGEATYAISEIVEDHHSALLAQPRSAWSVAHRMTQLLNDPQIAWKLRDTARHEAYSFFSSQHYRQCLSDVYQQTVAGHDVEIPVLEASGGLRFTGR